MKKQTTFKCVALISAVILVAIGFVATMYDPNILHNALSWLMNSPDGISMAVGTVVAGGTVTQQAATGGDSPSETTEYLDMKDVERKVELYKPYQTPLLTLITDNGVGTFNSWEKKYYAVDTRGMSAEIAACDSYTSNVATLEVDDSSIFTLYNTVYFPSITTATTKVGSGRSLMGIITGFPETNHITVKIINYGNANASGDFTNGMLMYRGGSAHNETAASTTAWGILPEPDYNYMQYFMEQVEESEIQQIMKKEADWGMADLKRAAIEDFKLQRERTFLNGVRSTFNLTINNETKRFYTCGGILNDTGIPLMANQTLSTLASTSFVTWLKTIFTGNNGSKLRYFLGGCDMIEAIEKVKVDNKWILSKESEVVLGINWVKLVSSFGTLDVAYYEQLDLLGTAYKKYAIVVDKPNIKAYDLEKNGFNVRGIDYKSDGTKKVNAAAIEQISTLTIKNKVTHHIIQGV